MRLSRGRSMATIWGGIGATDIAIRGGFITDPASLQDQEVFVSGLRVIRKLPGAVGSSQTICGPRCGPSSRGGIHHDSLPVPKELDVHGHLRRSVSMAKLTTAKKNREP